ncbi:MAG TPA: GTP-binding protein [Albitalea sp.]
MAASSVTPVTVLTGFLGSGKTTLLNALVRDPRFAGTAVVVNEWGEAAIDHALVREATENVVVLPSGCICCRVAGDLVRALRELHFQRVDGKIPDFRRVVIETTGLADPAPLMTTLIEMPLAAARYSLAGVVATVDAEHGMGALDAHAEAVKQVAMADRVVVTKCDRARPEAIAALEARVAALNPGAGVLRSSGADVDPALILETGLYRGERAPPDAAGWLNAGAYRHAGRPAAGPHDARIASFVWRAQEPLPWDDVESALETLAEVMGGRILRLKGLVNVAGEPGPRAVHAVQHTLYPSARLAAWPDDDRSTRLVFIGRDLDEAPVAAILESFLDKASAPWQAPSKARTSSP